MISDKKQVVWISGTSCTSDAGGHYFSPGLSDPWTNVGYTYNANGNTAGSKLDILTGYSQEEILGRAFIVHDYTGARIACAIIAAGKE